MSEGSLGPPPPSRWDGEAGPPVLLACSHGTDDPASLGQAVQSGCIRMSNVDIEELARSLPVGIPVHVVG